MILKKAAKIGICLMTAFSVMTVDSSFISTSSESLPYSDETVISEESTSEDASVFTDVQAASKVRLSKTKKTIYKGRSYTLKMKGTSKKVKWSSSNKKVATVNSKGKVTAKKKGTATITAKVGGKKYKCKVTVKNISPKISSTKKSIAKGNTATLKVSGTPDTPKWSSSNKKIATVSSSGKVTAKKTGTCTIKAKVNGKALKCKVTVKKAVPITKVSLSSTSVNLSVGNTKTLTATVSPSNTTQSKKVTWSSSKTSVATVNSSGKITAKKAGTATITAKSSNGKKKTCKVYVNDKVSFKQITEPIISHTKNDSGEFILMNDDDYAFTKQIISDFYGQEAGYSKEYDFSDKQELVENETRRIYIRQAAAATLNCHLSATISKSRMVFTVTMSSKNSDLNDLAYDALKSAGVTSGMNRKTAVEKINSWLCKVMTYESGQADVNVGFTEKRGCCTCYSEMFNAMCQRAGISVSEAVGTAKSSKTNSWENHAWNKVKLDGKWYYIDVCWNDTGGNTTKYYLSTSLWDNHKVVS